MSYTAVDYTPTPRTTSDTTLSDLIFEQLSARAAFAVAQDKVGAHERIQAANLAYNHYIADLSAAMEIPPIDAAPFGSEINPLAAPGLED